MKDYWVTIENYYGQDRERASDEQVERGEYTHVELPYTSYGDYDNSSWIEYANVQALKEDLASRGIEYVEYRGGFGFHTILIPREHEESEWFKELEKRLDDYPLLDEELHSELVWNAAIDTLTDAYGAAEGNLEKVLELYREEYDRVCHEDGNRIMYVCEDYVKEHLGIEPTW